MKTKSHLLLRFMACYSLLLLLSCKKDYAAEQTFIQKYNGEPYKGTAAVTINTGASPGNTVNGTSSAQLMEVRGDSATVVITTKLSNINSLNLKIKGKQDKEVWSSAEGELNLQISPQGIISGQTTTQQEQYDFEGSMTETNFILKMHVVQLKQIDNLPAGTQLTVTYNAQREKHENSSGGKGNCRTVVRPISTPTGVVMGMVPECD
ncbi:hypothetical protein ACMA1I_04365 [Pontibacter sp. 13R65]|uniref:hypothetical protein n=1 Tax=Pontibacter sp. 13R65 TaxID=3127458 RepID=UPI00301B9846